MFIVDDILFFPIRGICWIAREIRDAAQQEMATDADTITAKLSELYIMFETGRITEAEFGAREKELLDRLEEMDERTTRIEAGYAEAEEQEPVDSVTIGHREAVNA